MSEIASRGQLRMAFLRWAVVTVPLILLLGFASGRLVQAGSENPWYALLAKPDLTPPDWMFPVAWSTLYVLQGFALAMVLHARGSRMRGPAVLLFAVQLLLGLCFMPLFFGMHRVSAALLLIVAVAVVATAATLAFGRVRTIAAWLMVPTCVWLCFASVLTWRIHQLNPGAETLVPSSGTTQIDI